MSKWILWTSRLLALVALSASTFLSWKSHQGGAIPGCSGAAVFDCDHVLNSRWSHWLEIPVGYFGVATYACVFGLLWLVGQRRQPRLRQVGWLALTPLLVMALTSAVWFTVLQIVAIGKLCPYCMTAHVCGVTLATLLGVGALLIRRQQSTKADDSVRSVFPQDVPGAHTKPAGLRAQRIVLAGCLGVLGFALLVAGQLLFPHSTFRIEEYESVDSSDDLISPGAESHLAADDGFLSAPGEFDMTAPSDETDPLLEPPGEHADEDADSFAASDLIVDAEERIDDGNTVVHTVLKPTLARQRYGFYPSAPPMDVYRFPILGDAEAEHLIVELVDYTCSHCREMYPFIEAARRRYDGQLAVSVRPVALEKACNPYLRHNDPKHKDACKYARLALAVWHTDRSKFAKFHHWLMEDERAPGVTEASSFAGGLIGSDALRQGVRDEEVLGMLGDSHAVWTKITGNLPMLFVERRLVQGIPESERKLFAALEQLLPIVPRETE